MTCASCEAAEADALSGMYSIGCIECQTRQLAHGQEHFTSKSARRIISAYQALLEATYGAEWQAGHEQVKRWAERIAKARK